MPIPKDIKKAIAGAGEFRRDVKAAERGRRRREREEERTQAAMEERARARAPAAAEAVFAWVQSSDAEELRQVAASAGVPPVTVLGPTWGNNGQPAPALHTGTWQVALHATRPALLVTHRFHPAGGFQKEVRASKALLELLPPLVLLRLAADVAGGRIWRAVRGHLSDRDILRSAWEEELEDSDASRLD